MQYLLQNCSRLFGTSSNRSLHERRRSHCHGPVRQDAAIQSDRPECLRRSPLVQLDYIASIMWISNIYNAVRRPRMRYFRIGSMTLMHKRQCGVRYILSKISKLHLQITRKRRSSHLDALHGWHDPIGARHSNTRQNSPAALSCTSHISLRLDKMADLRMNRMALYPNRSPASVQEIQAGAGHSASPLRRQSYLAATKKSPNAERRKVHLRLFDA